ncbi:CMRF35-like molecule 8 isoform X1 [Lutra lutra]|uniref:CMRF35-like molecule 8 isoform X1 n=1 Tax=Lutra lutra TaxID=9657 RepID=UPI001FD15996|nr:CMRF35-like molecule 8 isoform X1 [Lutra lutra]XP_047561935.1 CMRF35-like molecule 8 isoform X1 [Lutra lutra]XP_047561936.1 CMRF35-like molecule 8 isoform X1 [Lutra lutra]XP_047561937.1 CMRF35-like molecule 8 isoform X1 [Lutra lutra]XP_047561938.1 CMRF35-like molecule 8 isoform X1 [Lutra lutra]XP_047561939.1 CMRF35-like molecule 8 isoform X2 [Lutra lutra]XP_047561940.1 CMRF35-like molecule 8 isoform X1 [Lutra lutra]
MTQQARVPWLSWALLLLWVPGCWSLSGPTSVTGTMGGSVSVQCQYEEEFTENAKYWCKKSLCVWKIIKTKRTDREVRKGRVSIRDHPANLTFTVTLESLTEDDAGMYLCGIDSSLFPGYLFDDTFQVVLSVTPATTPASPVSTTVTQMSTTTAKITTSPSPPSSAAPTATKGATCSASSQEEFPPSQGPGLQVLLSLLALLLLLLGGSSLLAWRMVCRRVKSGENPKQPQFPGQQEEPHYENLELQTWPLREEPMHPRQPEVEYSTVKTPREEPHYSTVVFDFQSGGSEANSIRSQRTLDEETQYSVIKKT